MFMANVQEDVILHYKTFYFGKTCTETAKKIRFKKNQTFSQLAQ
jgi:hypothetical protein